ncbi:hypothetical protein SAMN04489801_6214 [Pseudomonas mandelii]|uniref:Uncharacterized protein n=1 Tax=Pseudomonas mandelii TaxID=75612 RepID=A0ABY0W2K2_9PSED|nr:hypothetical protein SAMN04489801_6214 [Pseudomonas mandelii]
MINLSEYGPGNQTSGALAPTRAGLTKIKRPILTIATMDFR